MTIPILQAIAAALIALSIVYFVSVITEYMINKPTLIISILAGLLWSFIIYVWIYK